MNFERRRNPPCPWLPAVGRTHDFSVTRRHGVKGAEYYADALRYAQFHWTSGKPAQAILQLNKAWMADWEEADVSPKYPPPYAALRWMMESASAGNCGYLGNPVRHFQHLASRLTGPRAEVRSWRAWVCFHLAELVLDRTGFPRDAVQMAREGLWIPSRERALEEVARRGWRGEGEVARGVFVA